MASGIPCWMGLGTSVVVHSLTGVRLCDAMDWEMGGETEGTSSPLETLASVQGP